MSVASVENVEGAGENQRRNACPPDRTFAQLLEGALAPAALRALEIHCDGCARCARVLTELARTVAPQDEQEQWLGGRYRLLGPLGAGGMGVVYTALDTKLQRKVAVKRLREAGGGASIERHRARFLREAQLLASLSHPNVLTVHDVGGTDGQLYVVTELVDGWSMSQWVTEARPPPGWRQIVDMYLQAGRGLSAAHRLDVVHRDVKPANILVSRSGRVLIGDFGLAGLAATPPSEPARAARAPVDLTQTGTVLGTPAYMAPEVHAGESSDAGADQFAFCTSLYESLHGRRPFPGQTSDELVAAVRAGRLALGLDGIPRAVDRVLARGLAADRRQRFPSVDALLADLERARDRPSRQRVVGAVAMAMVALAAAVAATTITRNRPAERAPVEIANKASPMPAGTGMPDQVVPAARDAPENTRPPPTIAHEEPPPRTPPRRRVLARPAQQPAVHDLPVPVVRSAPTAAVTDATEPDPLLLLYLADSAHSDRDGVACLAALERLPSDAWPASLADLVLRRRATCEMLRGNCQQGQKMLEPLDGDYGAREAALSNCPATAFATVEDRLSLIIVQADEARYAGNRPARREALERLLRHETSSPEIQTCFRDRMSSRACGRRLTTLARGYQVLAEAFLAAGDCRAGALLDVMQSEVKFQTTDPAEDDPALRCRAERTGDIYKACAAAAQDAERQCLARVLRGAPPDGTTIPPQLGH